MKKLDVHTERAVTMFNVAPDAVTPRMRNAAKSLNYMDLYTPTSPQPAPAAPDVDVLVGALESLMKGYESLLEGGIDRITNMWTGNCYSIPDMLRDAQEALATHRKGNGQ